MHRPLHDTCSPQPYDLTQRVSLGKGSSKIIVSIIRTVV